MVNPMEEVHEMTAQKRKGTSSMSFWFRLSKTLKTIANHFDYFLRFFAFFTGSRAQAWDENRKKKFVVVKKANTTRPQSLAIEGNYEIHSNNWNNVLVVFRLHPRSRSNLPVLFFDRKVKMQVTNCCCGIRQQIICADMQLSGGVIIIAK